MSKKSASGVRAPKVGPRLLAGGNPQIPKGEGDAPVRAYIDAVPGWKRGVVAALDTLVERHVPGVRKAVKWNSPLYGSPEGEGTWFASLHCFERYVKVAFFDGAMMEPPPPEPSKQARVRYFHVHEGEAIDEGVFGSWVRQAASLPGERM